MVIIRPQFSLVVQSCPTLCNSMNHSTPGLPVHHQLSRLFNIQPKPSLHQASCHLWNMSVQFSSVAQSCPTLCDHMNHSTPGLPVHHHLLEFTQTRVHWVSDAIQPSHPLSSPCPPAPNPSQHQSLPMNQLFAWGGQSTGVSALASFLPKNSQGWSPSEWTGWISLQSKELSRAFSNTTVQTHQFFGIFSIQFSSVQFISVAQSCLTLCDPLDCSMPGLPVHH